MNETSYYRGASEAEDAMAVTARWISGNRKIKVVYHTGKAVDADVEKGIIRIPRMACASGITQEALMLLRSRVYHEAGHIDETVAVAKKDYPKEKSLFDIWNALEDRRMEAVEADKHQGCKVVFKWANDYYNREIASKVTAGEVDAPLWEAMVAMSFMVEGLSPLWKLSKKAHAYVEASYDKFMTVKQCADSKESLELAREIYEILKKKNEEMKKQQEQKQQEQKKEQKPQQQEKGKPQKDEGDGEGDADGEQGEGSEDEEKKDGSKGSKKGDKDSEKGDEGSEKEEKGSEEGEGSEEQNDEEDGKSSGAAGDFEDEEDEGEGKEEGSDEGEGSEQGEEKEQGGEQGGEQGEEKEQGEGSEEGEVEGKSGEEGKPDVAEYECRDEEFQGEQGKVDKRGLDEELEGISKEEVVNEKLEELFKGIDPSDQYVSRRDMDKHEVPDGSDEAKAEYKQQRDEVSSTVAGLTQALQQALRSLAKKHKKPYLRQGKIDRKRLVAISKGLSKEVFFRVKEGIELDVAVSITIDESGSMFSKVEDTRKTAMVVCEALEAIGVPFEVTGFSTTGWGCALEDGFDRTNPVLYRHYKTFGENWGSVRQRIVNSSALRHNVDGEVVEYAAFRLAQRKESRKVIFSLSDGLPEAGHGNDREMAANLKRVCARARKAGIEVYGFGIGTDAPKGLYGEKYFVKMDGDEGMGPAFVKRVSGVVTGGLVKV